MLETHCTFSSQSPSVRSKNLCARTRAQPLTHIITILCCTTLGPLYCFTVSSKQVFPVLAPHALTPMAHVSYVMLFVVVWISGMQLCDTRLLLVVILQQLAMSTLTGVFVLPLVFPVTCSCCDCSGSATQSSLHCGWGCRFCFPCARLFLSLLISRWALIHILVLLSDFKIPSVLPKSKEHKIKAADSPNQRLW